MRNYFNRLALCSLILLSTIVFNACKKVDINVTEMNPVDRFFKLPANASPEIKRIIEDLKVKNEAHPFVEQFIVKEGYPLWEYAKMQQKKNNRSVLAKEDGEESAEIIDIPVVQDSAKIVKDILSSKLGEEILYKLYKGDEYVAYGFDKDPNRQSLSANDIVAKIMAFERDIWGEEYFKIFDNRLFDYWEAGDEKPQSFNVLLRVQELTIHMYWVCGTTTGGYVTGDCDPAKEHCFDVIPIYCHNSWQTYFDDGEDESVDGWTNTPIAEGGGGSGGSPSINGSPGCVSRVWRRLEWNNNYNALEDPCTNAPPFIGLYGSNVVNDFEAITNYPDWFNSIDPTGLNDYPCLKSILEAITSSTNFYNTIQNFTGTNATGNIKFRTNNLTDIADVARTLHSQARQLSTIEFSLYLLSHSTKSFATITFVHEMIHADFDRILMRMGYDESIRNSYPKVIKALGGLRRPELTDHEFMSNEYIPYLKSVFQEVDDALGLGPHYKPGTTEVDPDYYDAMAWSGLQETTAWDNLPIQKRTIYTVILSREANQGPGCN